MYIDSRTVLTFCIIITLYCANSPVQAGGKYESSNTIVVQSGGGGQDDHDEGEQIIYTPIPIPLRYRKSVVNPSYLYPIHSDPSAPSYRLPTQRSIIHVPSPAPNLQPTPSNFFSRFQTVPPDDHYPLPPDHPNYRSSINQPSPNERQSNSFSPPQQQQQSHRGPQSVQPLPMLPPPMPPHFPPPPPPPTPVHSSPPQPPLALPSPTSPMLLSPTQPLVSTNPPSFFTPLQPMPNTAQVSDDRDNRYYSLHEPWPPAYANPNTEKKIKMTSSNEVQDGDTVYEDENSINNDKNSGNNNMADDEGKGGPDYPPGDQDYRQDYQNNYDRPDYNGNADYREDYQQPNKPKVNDGDAPEGNVEAVGGGAEDEYYQDYPNPKDYPTDYQGKPVENDGAQQTSINLPSDSQEMVNFQSNAGLVNFQNIPGQELIFGDTNPTNGLPNQSSEDKRPTYSEGIKQPVSITHQQPPDYPQDYNEDYYPSNGNRQATSAEQTEDNNDENTNNEDEEEDSNNGVDRSYDPSSSLSKPMNQFTGESTTTARFIDYAESNLNGGAPIEPTPMVTIPLTPGTRPPIRSNQPRFELTGDPYLDNYAGSKDSMENHLDSLNNGDYGKRNYVYNFNPDHNQDPTKTMEPPVPVNTYRDSNGYRNEASTPPIQFDYQHWPNNNVDYDPRSTSIPPSSPSPPQQANRNFGSPIDRYDQEDWGQY